MLHQKWILALGLAFLTIVSAAAQDASQLNTEKEKFSYALGVQMGDSIRK